MNKYNRMFGIIAVVAVAAVLITVTAISQDAFAHHRHRSQSLAQANACGNNNSFLQISKCQNLASQNQGDGNSVNVIGIQ